MDFTVVMDYRGGAVFCLHSGAPVSGTLHGARGAYLCMLPRTYFNNVQLLQQYNQYYCQRGNMISSYQIY